jgi:hypothetical protein
MLWMKATPLHPDEFPGLRCSLLFERLGSPAQRMGNRQVAFPRSGGKERHDEFRRVRLPMAGKGSIHKPGNVFWKSTVENRTDGTLDDGQPIRTSPVIVEKLEFRPKMEERL